MAHAGSWLLHTTGTGSATATGKKKVTWTAPADATGSVTLGSLAIGQSAGVGGTASASATLSATVTGTWKPDPALPSDPAPANVIVVEQSTAYAKHTTSDANGNSTPYVAGTADDGLGKSDPQDPSSGIVTGTLYMVKSGGSFTVSVSPSGKDTATSGPNGTNPDGTSFIGTGSCSVGFGPVTISTNTPLVTLAGTYDPAHGDNRALTGQQITAHLDTGGAPITISSYTWSFIGGTSPNPIKTWNPNGIAADGTTPQQLFPLTSTDLTGTDTSPNHTGISVADLPFYDQVADTVTVTCTVNFMFPDGTTGTVAPQSPPVTFLKPTAVWTLQTVPSYLGTVEASQQPGFYTDNVIAMVANAWWDPVNITDPPDFTGGKGGFAQIATLDRTFKGAAADTGTTITYVNQIKDANGIYYHPGTGLDGGFNYPLGYPDNNGKDGPQQSSSYTWDISVPGHSGDSPLVHLTQDISNVRKNYANVNDSFTTYLMFQPPGGIWVPLQKVTWSWSVTASLPLNTTQWDVPNPVFTCPAAQLASSPPSWNLVIPSGIYMGKQ